MRGIVGVAAIHVPDTEPVDPFWRTPPQARSGDPSPIRTPVPPGLIDPEDLDADEPDVHAG